MNTIHWSQQATYPVMAVLQLLPRTAGLLLLYLRKHKIAVTIGRLLALAVLLVAIDLYDILNKGTAAR